MKHNKYYRSSYVHRPNEWTQDARGLANALKRCIQEWRQTHQGHLSYKAEVTRLAQFMLVKESGVLDNHILFMPPRPSDKPYRDGDLCGICGLPCFHAKVANFTDCQCHTKRLFLTK